MRKICVFPMAQQKTLLKCWIGTVRWTYNQCVAVVCRWQCAPTKKALRAHFVTEFGLREVEQIKRAKSGVGSGGNNNNVGISWVFKTPHDLCNQAVGQFVTAYKNAVQAHGWGKFDIAFWLAKRLQQEMVVIRSRDWNRTRGEYAPIFGNTMLRSSESLPAKMDHEFQVTRTKLGWYYISIPVPLDVKHPIQQQQPDAVGGGDNQAPAVAPHAAAAIDPGVRTPFMVYSPDEARVYELGANDFGRIRRLCHHLDDLVSRMTDRDVRKKRRRRMRRAAARMRRRIRDLVDDLHWRAAKWLCETFETIIYPHYETSNMVVGKSKRRGLHSKTVRAMLTWSHFWFKQHLLHKIREYPSGCRVVLVDESYTSKTCGGCGRINHGLGKSKLFWCEQCGFRTDRDWNGARNIWLKFLTEWCNGSSRGNDDDDKEQQQQQQQ